MATLDVICKWGCCFHLPVSSYDNRVQTYIYIATQCSEDMASIQSVPYFYLETKKISGRFIHFDLTFRLNCPKHRRYDLCKYIYMWVSQSILFVQIYKLIFPMVFLRFFGENRTGRKPWHFHLSNDVSGQGHLLSCIWKYFKRKRKTNKRWV